MPGPLLFLLHDTYGFPPDLTADIARERGLTVDMAGYEREMEQQRERARAASKFSVDLRAGEGIAARSEFLGYETLEAESPVVALRREGALVPALQPGELGEVVLARTPFYAESGGQVGDTGTLLSVGGARFNVVDTQKLDKAIVHVGSLEGASLAVGAAVTARVDGARRNAIRLNHSATHLLHAALREVLGKHVTQKGSLVAPDRLRFDFAHFQPVSPQELRAHRAARERRDPRRCRRTYPAHGLRRRGGRRRDRAVRREVRARGARAELRRFLDRAVRWHARAAHRRHRPVPHPERDPASPPACAASRP